MAQASTIYKVSSRGGYPVVSTYIGHTSQFWMVRGYHNFATNYTHDPDHNTSLHRYMRDNGGIDNFEFTLLENFSYNNRRELFRRVRFYTEAHKAMLTNSI